MIATWITSLSLAHTKLIFPLGYIYIYIFSTGIPLSFSQLFQILSFSQAVPQPHFSLLAIDIRMMIPWCDLSFTYVAYHTNSSLYIESFSSITCSF